MKMNGIRTVRAIESVVGQRVNRSRILEEDNPNFTEESIVGLRAGLCELLHVLDEHRCRLAPNTQLPQEGLEPVHVVSVSSAPDPVMVLFFSLQSLRYPPADDLFPIGYVSIIFWGYLGLQGSLNHDRLSDEPNSTVPQPSPPQSKGNTDRGPEPPLFPTLTDRPCSTWLAELYPRKNLLPLSGALSRM